MRSLLIVGGMCAAILACTEPEQSPQSPPIMPIEGAQLDAMQRNLRKLRLAPPVWANVERSRDETRVVIHARVDGLSRETRTRYCGMAISAMKAELHQGQQLEIYLIDVDDGVLACR